MTEDPAFVFPSITDQDIRRAALHLGLPADALLDTEDIRSVMLKSGDSIDIAACPGSGKTTLLVVKLAILGEKWTSRTQGICVLSHTNVARREIESRLGNTSAGRALLSYPHFIGTIHSFVNDFLAIPWLRSLGYGVGCIDDEICANRRWAQVPFKTRSYLARNALDETSIRVLDAAFTIGKKSGALPFGSDTETYKCLRDACYRSAREGFHRFDEMFMWARDLSSKRPAVVPALRRRFPLVFIDEAQDNSEDQSEILFRLFFKGALPVIRQRFGDDNQAIFDSADATAAQTDKFPQPALKRDLPSSHRFGPRIAKLITPLALTPHTGGVAGRGPRKALASGLSEGRHTLFLFDKPGPHVFDAYASLLIETFSDSERKDGLFTAISMVHRPPSSVNTSKQPQHLGDYWPHYDADQTTPDPKPQTFVEYVLDGVARSVTAGESHIAVEMIARGLVRVFALLTGVHQHRVSCHRYLLDLLGTKAEAFELYKHFLVSFAIARSPLTEEMWIKTWKPHLARFVVAALGKVSATAEIKAFMEWPQNPALGAASQVRTRHQNLYAYPFNQPEVRIRAGSIHSVKGQTHTATLVLDCCWNDRNGKHNLQLLLDALSGAPRASGKTGILQQQRMRLHYVAMTRPTHLLCLAMKSNSLTDSTGAPNEALKAGLAAQGWHIEHIPTPPPPQRST
jgi:DNA helicase-2/ATP-dependent DNA helicase PcrA